MNPLKELKTMVSSSASVETGTVTSTSTSTVTVRARGGLKSFSTPMAPAFKPGDAVRFQGNVLLGRSIAPDTLPVFKV